MSSFNRVVQMGNLTKAPELRTLPGGKKVCEVPIAVNENYTDGDGNRVESVSFFDCVFWGRTAEVLYEYLDKGSPILVEGRLKQDRYEKDGEKRTKVKIVVEQMKMIGGSKSGDQSSESNDTELVGAGAGSDGSTF